MRYQQSSFGDKVAALLMLLLAIMLGGVVVMGEVFLIDWMCESLPAGWMIVLIILAICFVCIFIGFSTDHKCGTREVWAPLLGSLVQKQG